MSWGLAQMPHPEALNFLDPAGTATSSAFSSAGCGMLGTRPSGLSRPSHPGGNQLQGLDLKQLNGHQLLLYLQWQRKALELQLLRQRKEQIEELLAHLAHGADYRPVERLEEKQMEMLEEPEGKSLSNEPTASSLDPVDSPGAGPEEPPSKVRMTNKIPKALRAVTPEYRPFQGKCEGASVEPPLTYQ